MVLAKPCYREAFAKLVNHLVRRVVAAVVDDDYLEPMLRIFEALQRSKTTRELCPSATGWYYDRKEC
jgi:hypothetical protein